jgi:signal transduction histidine kinase
VSGQPETGAVDSVTFIPRDRSERLIASGRAALAFAALIAIWLDPGQPLRYAEVVYACLAGYLAYALATLGYLWRSPTVPTRFPIATQAFDVVAFTVLIYFTEGPASPFFVYFVFLVLCASLRWRWGGILWIAGISLVAFIGMGAYAARVLHEEGFALSRFLVRAVFLAVVAALMGTVASYERRLRREMFLLASWPRALPREVRGIMREELEHAAVQFEIPRTLAVWEEGEEPWVHVASWSRGEFAQSREAPDTWAPLVDPRLPAMGFFCPDLERRPPVVLYASSAGLQRGSFSPLHSAFRDRFQVRSALGVGLRTHSFDGWLLWVDKARMTADDLLVAQIMSRQVAARLDRFYLFEGLREAAAAEERMRLARDLHDGLLQSLTGVALQVRAVHSLVEERGEVGNRLAEVQRLIAAEQHDLRSFIRDLRPGPLASSDASVGLEERLQELAKRVERQWGLTVELKVHALHSGIPESLGHHAYLMVNEAVVNAARHGSATVASVELAAEECQMRIKVADNGHGFTFRGRYDHAALVRDRRGPVSLKERVEALGGSLSIESAESGAILEISVPLRAPEA